MRVIECNECGEMIRGATDDELARRLDEHMGAEHPEVEWNGEQAADVVGRQAYSATDS